MQFSNDPFIIITARIHHRAGTPENFNLMREMYGPARGLEFLDVTRPMLLFFKINYKYVRKGKKTTHTSKKICQFSIMLLEWEFPVRKRFY